VNLVLWLLGGILGLAFLFVVSRIARLSDATPGERGPRWLLVLGVVIFAVGMILLVVGARSRG
jgi:hypothetical protein